MSLSDMKKNLGKIPKKTRKILWTVGAIPIGLMIYLFSTNEKTLPEWAGAKELRGQAVADNPNLDQAKKLDSASSDYMDLIKTRDAETAKAVIESDSLNGAFLGTPDTIDITSTAFTMEEFKAASEEIAQEIEKSEKTEADPKEKEDSTETSNIDDDASDKIDATLASAKELASRIDPKIENQRVNELLGKQKDAEKALENQVAQYFAFNQQIIQHWNQPSSNSPNWTTVIPSEPINNANNATNMVSRPQTRVNLATPPNSTEPKTVANDTVNIDVGDYRHITGAKALLPGDRLLATLNENINSDYPSPLSFTIASGVLDGAVVMGSFSSSYDRPVIKINSITWRGKSAAISAVATDPSENTNFVKGDVDYHTIERWTALASSYLVKGFSDAIVNSGSVTTRDAVGNTTTTQPARTKDEIYIQTGGALATKAAGIAEAYFNTAPTITIKSGEVMGLLITDALIAEWLPNIIKGKDTI